MDRKEIIDEIIQGRVFKNDQYVKCQKHFSILLNYLTDQQVSSSSIMSIKKYLVTFGFPFFMVFKNFYQKITQYEKQFFKDKLQYIADYVQKFFGNHYFLQLQFYFQFTRVRKYNFPPNQLHTPIFFLAFKLSQIYAQLCQIQINQKKQCQQKLQSTKNMFVQIYKQRQIKLYNYCQQYYLKQLYKEFFQNYGNLNKKRLVYTIQLQISQYNGYGGQIQPIKDSLPSKFFSFETFKIGQKHNQQLIVQQFLQNHGVITKYCQVYPCCRKYFVLHQLFRYPKSKILQFSNFVFPLGQKSTYIILQHICALLNQGGGIFMIGINQYNSLKKGGIVKGLTMNEEMRQLIYKQKDKIFNKFSPSLKQSDIQFVPIKIKQFGQYIPGQYVLRFRIIKENKQQLYSFQHENKDIFCCRQKNKTIILQGRNLFNRYLQRGKSHQKFHQGPCKKPEKGIILYQKNITFQIYGRACRQFLIDGYKKKQIYQTFQSLALLKGVQIYDKGQYHSLVEIKQDINFNKIHNVFEKINDLKGKNIFPAFKNIQIPDKLIKRSKQQLNQFNIFFVAFPLQNSTILRFKTIHDACSAFLLLKEFNIECYFSIK